MLIMKENQKHRKNTYASAFILLLHKSPLINSLIHCTDIFITQTLWHRHSRCCIKGNCLDLNNVY